MRSQRYSFLLKKQIGYCLKLHMSYCYFTFVAQTTYFYQMMNLKEMQQDLEFIFPIISGKVSTAINRMLFRNFRREKLDITPEQWTVLAFLWKEDGVTQQKLCDVTYKDKPSMTRLIDNLVKQNLVERKASTNDRRSNQIYLTPDGARIEERVNKAVNDTVEAALMGIDDEGRERIRTVLKLIFGNMQQALNDR